MYVFSKIAIVSCIVGESHTPARFPIPRSFVPLLFSLGTKRGARDEGRRGSNATHKSGIGIRQSLSPKSVCQGRVRLFQGAEHVAVPIVGEFHTPRLFFPCASSSFPGRRKGREERGGKEALLLFFMPAQILAPLSRGYSPLCYELLL